MAKRRQGQSGPTEKEVIVQGETNSAEGDADKNSDLPTTA